MPFESERLFLFEIRENVESFTLSADLAASHYITRTFPSSYYMTDQVDGTQAKEVIIGS